MTVETRDYSPQLVPRETIELNTYLHRELRAISDAIALINEQLRALDARITALEP